MKVDRQKIIEAALDLLNEVGVDRLSTRLIAERLGVRQPALYWHFKSKRALLDALNVEILARGHTHREPAAGEDWRSFLRANGQSFRRALLAYRDGARVHAGTEADPSDLSKLEAQMAVLVASGLPVAQAMELLVAIGRYVVGCVLEEQVTPARGPIDAAALDAAAKAYPLLSRALGHYRSGGYEAMFQVGLDLLIAGAAARLKA
jgi:TetR/AcrR family tetracycline transcriptional repressor